MPPTSSTAQVSEAAKPHSDALYTAAHKALCSLAFALQEVSTKQNKEENDHAVRESGQAQEEAAERGQHLCHDGKPACSFSNGRTIEVPHRSASRTVRAAIIVIPV